MYGFKVIYRDGASKIFTFEDYTEASKAQLKAVKAAKKYDLQEVSGVTTINLTKDE